MTSLINIECYNSQAYYNLVKVDSRGFLALAPVFNGHSTLFYNLLFSCTLMPLVTYYNKFIYKYIFFFLATTNLLFAEN